VDELIRTREVTKIYNARQPDEVRAVDGISLDVVRGEVVVLKGPSGSGKTTLLSIIGCMTRPTSGRVEVGGRDVARLPERFLAAIRRRTFGFIVQQYNLIRDLSLRENILLPLYPLAMPGREMERRLEYVLQLLDLTRRRQHKESKLSGGEQQRAAIARALINEPEILVADEPTAHLDRPLAGELLGILQNLNRDGKTILIATHDPFIYDHPFVDKTFAMRDGRLEEVPVP
jgi:putative ABC transport system ATP-binding protein